MDAIEDFHELRDKYGVLGKINLRIYFWLCKPKKLLVVLGAWNKSAEHQTPQRIIKRMKWRKKRAETLMEQRVGQKDSTTLSRVRKLR